MASLDGGRPHTTAECFCPFFNCTRCVKEIGGIDGFVDGVVGSTRADTAVMGSGHNYHAGHFTRIGQPVVAAS